MFTHYRTSGFILKKEALGEANQLFTIYTKDFGKLEVLGKGVRKIKSKLKGGLELFYLSEIEFIQGKAHKTLTDAVLIENFPILRKDLERLSIVYRISEVLDNLIRGQEPDEKIWNLLNEIFNKLNTRAIAKGEEETLVSSTNLKLEIRNCKLKIIYYYFLWNLLSILGYQPEVYNCSLCPKKLTPGELYWSPKEGGVICQSCFRKTKSGEKIESEIIKILRIILKKNWQTLSKLKIELNYLKSLNSIAESYLPHVLEGVK
jgi:DNA repair protein RecO (recombination protein O)